jgi:hypothetical protein
MEDILYPVIRLLLVALIVLTGCGPAPVRQPEPEVDPTTADWYVRDVQQLTAMNREAENLYKEGKYDEAGAIVTNTEPLQRDILSVPRPTLTGVEAAADRDQLYGTMLLRNRHYGWARLLFQKNEIRWRKWTPETPDSKRRLKMAVDAIAECDKYLLAK